MRRVRSRFRIIYLAGFVLGIAAPAFAEPEATRSDIESTISGQISTKEVSATLDECVLTISTSYPIQCFPNVDVGLVRKEVSIDLTEVEPSLELRAGLSNANVTVFSLEPAASIVTTLAEMGKAQEAIILSSDTLPPVQRQILISETMETLLQSRDLNSRVMLQSCMGGGTTGVLSSLYTTIDVPAERAAALQHDLEGYMKSHCGAGH